MFFFLNFFANNRHEKICQMLQTLFWVFQYFGNTGRTSGREGYIGSDWVFFMISPSVFDYTKGEFMSWKMINYVKKCVLYLKKKIIQTYFCMAF